ncbi:MAG: glycosyltransferase family 4 protein, partial [Deltaproteobacteria bacterium]|nr:glycosyltransferase family 4 protein [Deltaproteobacteria bacterium]
QVFSLFGGKLQLSKKPKLLFLVTEDYYFWSHRLLIAKAAQRAGFDVYVATHVNEHGDKIKQEGFILLPTLFSRNNQNLFRQFRALFELVQIFRKVKPDLVHNVALKAIAFGSIAAWLAGVKSTINLVTGLGVVFTDDRKKYRLLSNLYRTFLRVLFLRSNTFLILQNSDDDLEMKRIVPKAQISLIRGSGVNVEYYFPVPETSGKAVVTLVARMLWHKGIGELVEASRLLRARGEAVCIQLVGGVDYGNAAHILREKLLQWQDEGLIRWLGYREDVREIWFNSHIAILPSYREGLPKSLLEAAACGRPIITSDVPGCREMVIDGYNGFIVPVKNSERLANAIQKLVKDSDLRKTMGMNSRKLVCEQFSDDIVSSQTLELYRRCLN